MGLGPDYEEKTARKFAARALMGARREGLRGREAIGRIAGHVAQVFERAHAEAGHKGIARAWNRARHLIAGV